MCSLTASAYVLAHCLCLCAHSLPLLMCSLTASACVPRHYGWLGVDWASGVGMRRQTYFQLPVRLRCLHNDPFRGKQVRLTAVSLCRWIDSGGCSAFYIVLASAAYHIFTEKVSLERRAIKVAEIQNGDADRFFKEVDVHSVPLLVSVHLPLLVCCHCLCLCTHCL